MQYSFIGQYNLINFFINLDKSFTSLKIPKHFEASFAV